MSGNTNKKRRSLIIILAVVLAVALLGGGLLARYIGQNRRAAEMISSGFHISSNYAKEGTTPPEYNMPDWGSGVTVSVFNYELENVAQYSEMAIDYTITVTHGTLDKVMDGTTPLTATDDKYTIAAGPTKVEHVVYITPDGTGDVSVTIKAVSPYEKELKATLKIVSKALPDYTFEDRGDGTALLTIKSNDYGGTVTVKWDATKYSPDNTNPLMSDWKDSESTDGRTVTVEDNSTYFLIFIKNTTATVTTTTGTGVNTITLG